MNFDEAGRAHTEWKLKLAAYLAKPDKTLNAAEVESDCKCKLGVWIHGDGKKHQSIAAFAKLKEAHARFHRAAADVVRRADAGKNVKAETEIGAESPFASASSDVVLAIAKMKSSLRTSSGA